MIKTPEILTDIGRSLVYGKMTQGLPPIRKKTLSKKAHEKNDIIKRKLHTANRNLNGWGFQLDWNKLEWVNTRSKTV